MPSIARRWSPAVPLALLLAVAPGTIRAQSAERIARYRITESITNTREAADGGNRPPQLLTTTMYVVCRTRVVGDAIETEARVDSTRVTGPGIDQPLDATVGATYRVTIRPNGRERAEFRAPSDDRSAMMELVRIAKLMPLRPIAGAAWDTLDLTAPAPFPDKVSRDIRQFTPASDSTIGGVAMRTIVMRGTSVLSDPGSISLGNQPVTSVGAGESTGRWYITPTSEIEYARIDETFRTRITAGSMPEVTRVSRTRLELERLRDR